MCVWSVRGVYIVEILCDYEILHVCFMLLVGCLFRVILC